MPSYYGSRKGLIHGLILRSSGYNHFPPKSHQLAFKPLAYKSSRDISDSDQNI
jgi:hypothetical protein